MHANKFSIGGLIGVHVSSIVDEFVKTISSQFIFLRKDFERTKSIKAQKKQFLPLRTFYVLKIVAFVVFCSLVCVFVGWFWFDLRFCGLKILLKKE